MAERTSSSLFLLTRHAAGCLHSLQCSGLPRSSRGRSSCCSSRPQCSQKKLCRRGPRASRLPQRRLVQRLSCAKSAEAAAVGSWIPLAAPICPRFFIACLPNSVFRPSSLYPAVPTICVPRPASVSLPSHFPIPSRANHPLSKCDIVQRAWIRCPSQRQRDGNVLHRAASGAAALES